MAKNAKHIIPGPSIVAPESVVLSVTDKDDPKRIVAAKMNSTATAVLLTFTMVIGTETDKVDNDYKFTDSGSLEFPDSIVIDGIEYWLNVKSAWGKSKDGRRFKAGRNKISLSVKKPKTAAKPVEAQDIPF